MIQQCDHSPISFHCFRVPETKTVTRILEIRGRDLGQHKIQCALYGLSDDTKTLWKWHIFPEIKPKLKKPHDVIRKSFEKMHVDGNCARRVWGWVNGVRMMARLLDGWSGGVGGSFLPKTMKTTGLIINQCIHSFIHIFIHSCIYSFACSFYEQGQTLYWSWLHIS